MVLQWPAGSAEIREGVWPGGNPARIGRRRAGSRRFLAIEFPGGRLTAPGFEKLLGLADQGIVDILDMEFIAKDAEGRGDNPWAC